jgi:phosphate uptake regulator
MMELNREQIIKMLETIDEVGDCSRDCIFYNGKVHSCGGTIAKHALALIKELTEKNEELKSDLKDAEEEYERVYEQAEADIRGNMADGGTSCHWCIAGHRADVVRKIQGRMMMHFGTYTDKTEVKVVDVFKLMGQIAEEMLEENNV